MFGDNEQWLQLFKDLNELSTADLDIIDNQFKSFMAWFDQSMKKINHLLENNDVTKAIVEKRQFLSSLEPEYNKNKAMLEDMTDTIGRLSFGL
jgi:hypothetical protein